jgi:hypothetical protein
MATAMYNKTLEQLLHVKSRSYTFDTGSESTGKKIYIATFKVLVLC